MAKGGAADTIDFILLGFYKIRTGHFVKKGSGPHSKNFCDEKFFDPLFGQKRRAFSCYFDVKI